VADLRLARSHQLFSILVLRPFLIAPLTDFGLFFEVKGCFTFKVEKFSRALLSWLKFGGDDGPPLIGQGRWAMLYSSIVYSVFHHLCLSSDTSHTHTYARTYVFCNQQHKRSLYSLASLCCQLGSDCDLYDAPRDTDTATTRECDAPCEIVSAL